MSEQRHLASARPVFFRQETSAKSQLDAEDRREIVRDASALDALGVAAPREIEAAPGPDRHTLEQPVVLAPGVKIGIRNAGVIEIPLRRSLIEVHQALRLREGKGAKEQAVEDAEHRRGAGNPQRQHGDDHEARGGLLGEGAAGVLEVLEQVERLDGYSACWLAALCPLLRLTGLPVYRRSASSTAFRMLGNDRKKHARAGTSIDAARLCGSEAVPSLRAATSKILSFAGTNL